MNFSAYDIALARRVTIADFLTKNGYKLISEGSGNFRVPGHQGLIVKNHYWFRHSTNEYGNPIDFLMKFERLNFQEAVLKLTKKETEIATKISWSFETETVKARKYLIETRKIDPEISDQLINLKKIKQDRANCICFIEYDNFAQPTYIFRRNMNSKSTFKGEVKGSKKSQSFEIFIKEDGEIAHSNIDKKAEKLYIVEGAIDACAMATLLKTKRKGRKSEKIKIISTAGNPHKSIKERIANTNPKEIIIATDMDKKGRDFAKTIQNWIKTEYCSVATYNAKDPSELLFKISQKK